MRSVLGVSAGAAVVQLARPRRDTDFFEVQPVDARGEFSAELAAEATAAALDSRTYPTAIAVAYRDQDQAAQLQDALDQRRVIQYELVTEVSAALEYFDAQGIETPPGATAVYDFGASGLTVTVVDWHSGEVHFSQRTTEIGGDVIDALIRDQQLELGTVEPPARATDLLLLDAQCRAAKEQLAHTNAAAVTGELGVVLLAQHDFHALISAPVQWAARFTQDIIWRSGTGVGSVIAIGGGARMQLALDALHQVTGLPVITDPEPAAVTARGAALIATEFAADLADGETNEPAPPLTAEPRPPARTRRRAVALAGAVATALAVVAGIGLLLGGGKDERQHNTGSSALPSGAPGASSAALPSTAAPAATSIPPATSPDAAPAAAPEADQAPRRPLVRRTPAPPPPPSAVHLPFLPPIILPPPLQPGPPPPPNQPRPQPFPGLAPR